MNTTIVPASHKHTAAYRLRLEGKTFKEIRTILNLPGPEATRAAVARGQRLNAKAQEERELRAAIKTLATILLYGKITAEQLDAHQPSTLNSQLPLEPPPVSEYWTKVFIPAYVLFRMSSRRGVAKATRRFQTLPPNREIRETRPKPGSRRTSCSGLSTSNSPYHRLLPPP